MEKDKIIIKCKSGRIYKMYITELKITGGFIDDNGLLFEKTYTIYDEKGDKYSFKFKNIDYILNADYSCMLLNVDGEMKVFEGMGNELY